MPFITLGSLKLYRGLAKQALQQHPRSTSLARREGLGGLGRILATEPDPACRSSRPGVWVLLAVLSVVIALMLRYDPSSAATFTKSVRTSQPPGSVGSTLLVSRSWFIRPVGLATGLAGVMQFIYLDATGDPVTAEAETPGDRRGRDRRCQPQRRARALFSTLIGCLIMSVLNNGCVHAPGIPNASQDIIIGIIIIVAVTVDRFRRGLRTDGTVGLGNRG